MFLKFIENHSRKNTFELIDVQGIRRNSEIIINLI